MSIPIRLGILVAVLAVAVLSSLFVVQQTQTALVLRFGAVQPVQAGPGLPSGLAPGLHFKLPFIDNVVYFDRRILDLDLPAQEVIASDQKRLVVDAYGRYRILDPLRFFQSVNSIPGANNRLGSIVNSTIRSVLGDATFASVVRTDRDALTKRIANDVNASARGLGVEVVDVRLRRVDLPEQNSQAVFQRMQTERQREAADIRAQGTQISIGIRAKADRDVTVIVADANRKAEELRGSGDADRNRILAEAYGRDADFFAFYRSMQAYEASLKPGETRLVLTPSSEFFRFFNDPQGKGGGNPPPAGPAATASPPSPPRS